MQAGQFKPGSTTDRVFQFIKAHAGQHEPVSRLALGRGTRLPPKEVGRALDVLCRNGQVIESIHGFSYGGEARPIQPAAEPAPLPPLDETRRQTLEAVIRRAHQYRRAGAPSLAVSLLERAAKKRLPEHVQADLAALAGLFADHAGLYPTLDLSGSAA